MDTVRTMTGTFAAATSVQRRSSGELSGDVGGERVMFDAEIKPGWDINGNANGGYLLAIAGRAMAEVAGRPPLTVTAHYLKPGPAGPCEVEVTTVRAGRRLATMTGSLRMGGTEIIRLLGTFGEQTPGGPTSRGRRRSICRPTRTARCHRLRPKGRNRRCSSGSGSACARRTSGSAPAGRAARPGWTVGSRLADEEPIDAIALLLAPMRSRRRCSTPNCRWRGCRRWS